MIGILTITKRTVPKKNEDVEKNKVMTSAVYFSHHKIYLELNTPSLYPVHTLEHHLDSTNKKENRKVKILKYICSKGFVQSNKEKENRKKKKKKYELGSECYKDENQT